MEPSFVSWIRARAPATGDDCAVLPCAPWGDLLVTVDSVLDGVHLDAARHGLDVFGYKAVARGLSDIAAMGGEPLWVVLAATLTSEHTIADAQQVFLGAERAGCSIVGGDTAVGPALGVTATVIGRADAGTAWRRSGARVGDSIVATGSFGRSLPTDHHATFIARNDAAKALREQADVGAAIDVSDGLSTDLLHILTASGVGCELHADAIPRRDEATLEEALGDGEDYELLATIRPGPIPAGFTRLGEITSGDPVLVCDDARSRLRAKGWEHGA